MTKSFMKDGLKKFLKTANRFIAIMLITAIGVAFFVGLRSTAPSMQKTLDEYYKEYNFMDLKITSGTGLTEDDKSNIQAVDGVKTVELTNNLDVTTKVNNTTSTVRLVSYNFDGENNINDFQLIKGELPTSENEILVDNAFFEDNNLKLGDTIEFDSGTKLDLSYMMKETSYKIVGTINSPEFLMTERGSSYIGSGHLSGYFFVNENNFTLPYYTSMEIRIDNPDNYSIFSQEYKDLVSGIKDDINEVMLENHAENTFFIQDHESDINFVSYEGDGDRIAALGLVIPILFFTISIMVTMTSMTRLVDSDLTLIGTYKALGYRNLTIASHYLFYAISASGIGGIIGVVLGYSIFPKLIIGAFRTVYEFSDIKLNIEASLIILSLFIAISFAAIPSFVIAMKSMRKNPAILMRPVIPTKGKKILIERLKPVWKRISFSNKVMLRNIFRYKKRLFMTILGVAGCTALIFAGFALRDAIQGVSGKQYGEIQKFDVNISLTEGITEDQISNIETEIENNGGESYITAFGENLKIINDDSEKGISLIAFSNNEHSDFFTLRNRQSGDELKLTDDGILITEKIAKEFDLKVGDTALFKNQDGTVFEGKVDGIVENYINHYVFSSFDAYKSIFNEDTTYNTIFVNLDESAAKNEDTFTSKILLLDGVSGVSSNIQSKTQLNTTLKTLDFVVLVLILSAVALIFVVLFSLTSINIEERKRELATLKVLGFRRKEMISYIFKEIFILTVVGAFIGLLLGLFIQRYIISTMETSVMMFSRDINFTSYLYSILLTLFFAGLVNLAMFRQITTIDMVSSLKSIE